MGQQILGTSPRMTVMQEIYSALDGSSEMPPFFVDHSSGDFKKLSTSFKVLASNNFSDFATFNTSHQVAR